MIGRSPVDKAGKAAARAVAHQLSKAATKAGWRGQGSAVKPGVTLWLFNIAMENPS